MGGVGSGCSEYWRHGSSSKKEQKWQTSAELRSSGVTIEAGRQAGHRSQNEAMHFEKYYMGLHGEVL